MIMQMTGLEAHLRLNEIEKELVTLTNLITQEQYELEGVVSKVITPILSEGESLELFITKREDELTLLRKNLTAIHSETLRLKTQLQNTSFIV